MTGPGREAPDEPELEGAGPVVTTAWVLSVLLACLGGLLLAGGAVLLFRKPSQLAGTLPVLGAAVAMVLAGGGFIRGVEACRILMTGLSVVVMGWSGVLIYQGVAFEGLASTRLLFVVPFVAGASGAFAFIHPEVREWARRRRSRGETASRR